MNPRHIFQILKTDSTNMTHCRNHPAVFFGGQMEPEPNQWKATRNPVTG